MVTALGEGELEIELCSRPAAKPADLVEHSAPAGPTVSPEPVVSPGPTVLPEPVVSSRPAGQRVRFQIVAETEAVPSESAVRVGSYVEIIATQRRLLRVEVFPFSEWIRRHP